MKTPLISVLLPVFNEAQSLRFCLESIQQQTFPDFEGVVVDDGSLDLTPTVIEQQARADRRIRGFYRPHGGIVEALNFGLEQCRGKYIARMDGDDWMHPQRLEQQLRFLEAHPELGLIGSLVEGIPTTTDYQQWSNRLVTHQAITQEIFVESPIMHPTFFGQRTLFEKLGGYCAHPWAEDYDFLLRAHQKGVCFGKVEAFLVRKKDSPTRLSRLDWRYKRAAMFQAKVHYFLQGNFLNQKKGVVIAGTGSSGRKVAKIFKEHDIPILCLLDNRLGPPGRTVLGRPAYGIDDFIPQEVLALMQKGFLISAIGDPKGREHFLRLLAQARLPNGEKPRALRFI